MHPKTLTLSSHEALNHHSIPITTTRSDKHLSEVPGINLTFNCLRTCFLFQNIPPRGAICAMQPEQFFTSVCGGPLTANTAINKDIGIYHQNLIPYSVSHAFKKSSAPPHSLAVSDTHVFAAQENKATVHVYSRAKGNQECFVSFPERIRCIALIGNVLVLGTVEGRLILWEV